MRPIVLLKSWTDKTENSIKAVSMGNLLETTHEVKVENYEFFLYSSVS